VIETPARRRCCGQYWGLEDEVDNHWLELFKAAALSTLLGAVTERGSSRTDNDTVHALSCAMGIPPIRSVSRLLGAI
jgi:hypothetical protein